MKKLLIINTEYKEFGGEDANIIDELSFFKQKYDVSYLKFSNKNKLNLSHVIGFFTGTNYLSNKRVSTAINKYKPDYIYIHNTWFEANLGIFKVIRKSNIPTFLKVHNYRFDCSRFFLIKNHLRGKNNCSMCSMNKKQSRFFNKYFKESYLKSFLIVLYSKKYFKLLLSDTFQILCLTEFQRKYMQSLGINEDKLNVLHNPNINHLIEKNYNSDSNYVVYAGRIDNSKGVDSLLETWKNINIKNLTLKIIGTGNKLNYLKGLYLTNNIEFLGHLSNEETIKEIRSARAVITATKMYEGQPRILSEASSNGVPCIFPKFGGMTEFFPKNYPLSFEQFNYFDLEEKLKLLNNKILLMKISNDVYNFNKIQISNDTIFETFSNIVKNYK